MLTTSVCHRDLCTIFCIALHRLDVMFLKGCNHRLDSSATDDRVLDVNRRQTVHILYQGIYYYCIYFQIHYWAYEMLCERSTNLVRVSFLESVNNRNFVHVFYICYNRVSYENGRISSKKGEPNL